MITDVVSRAYEITMSSPRGPVYLSLPREPLGGAAAGADRTGEAALRAGACRTPIRA